MNRTTPRKSFPWGWLMGIGLALIAFAFAYNMLESHQVPQGNLTNSAIGHEYDLVDETGQAVTQASYDGKWRLMYFGYTWCPDICPTDTATMAQALQMLREHHPKAAARLQPLFLTIDPERDTPEVLAEYTENFDPELIGLTGSPEQVEATLKTFRIYATKLPGDSADDWHYDHQAMFYLMDPKGRPVQFLVGQTASAEDLLAMLERFLV